MTAEIFAHCVSVATVFATPFVTRHYADKWLDHHRAMRRIRRNIRAQQRRMYN